MLSLKIKNNLRDFLLHGRGRGFTAGSCLKPWDELYSKNTPGAPPEAAPGVIFEIISKKYPFANMDLGEFGRIRLNPRFGRPPKLVSHFPWGRKLPMEGGHKLDISRSRASWDHTWDRP